MQLVLSLENKGKRLEVFVEEKGKEEKSDKDVPDIKKGRSTSTSINSKITKKDLKKKGKMVLLIDEDEELTDEDDREYLKSKKFQVLKNSLIQNLSKGNLLLDEIDHKLDQASLLNPKDDQLKKIIKKRNNLFFKSYIGGKKDDRYSIDAKVDFKSKDGGKEIEYLIPAFEKGLSNNKRIKLNTFELLCMIDNQLENDIDVEPSNNGIELVNDLTQILSPKVDISDMQIGLPGVVQNDEEISIESKCFYGMKLNDVDSNKKEYGLQQLATKSQEKRQQPKNVTFYERKVTIQKELSENEKKVAEFIWRACNDGSLFPNVEVAASILDIWSLVLNHEEKYREKNSGGGNIYCCCEMLSDHLIENGADLIRRRSIFESNITAVLSQSPYESFHDVDLVFFPTITTKRSHHFYLICFNMKTAEIDIIDNLDNDVDDIMEYKHMETYVGSGIFLNEFKKEGQGQELQLRILRIKYLTKIIMLSINERRAKVMKQEDEYTKTQTKSSRIIKDENLLVSDNLLETIRVRVSKILDVEKSKI
ncbi:ulp1 protease family, C-terminal catalytic domain-containing protein [Tanacetum coccineum]